MADMSSYSRDHMAVPKPQIFTICPSIEKICQPLVHVPFSKNIPLWPCTSYLPLLRKSIQNLEIRQKNDHMSFWCHTEALPDRPTQRLFNFLQDLPLFDLRFTTDQGPDSEVTY